MRQPDDELRQRFEELRAAEARGVPAFHRGPPPARHFVALRFLAAASALFVLLTFLAFVIRPRWQRTTFSGFDRAVTRSISSWRPPTEFLLRTPGREMLATTPLIPDLTDVPLPPKGALP